MSHTERRRHAHPDSSTSLAPLLFGSSPEADFIVGSDKVDMPREAQIPSQDNVFTNNGGLMSQPPLPPIKPQSRVFSKRSKRPTQAAVAIPGSRTREPLNLSLSPESEGWEMSPQGIGESHTRDASLDSPTPPPDRAVSGPLGHDLSQEEQNGPCPYLIPIDSASESYPTMFPFSENHHADSPTSATEEEFMTSLRDRAETRHIRRFDSGVGDSESEQGSRRCRSTSDAPSSTSASSSYPRLSRMATHYEQHYEDIDAYKKYVHPDRPSPPTGLNSNGQPHLARMALSGVTIAETDDRVSPSATQLQSRMVRPNLDPRTASLPHSYSHLETNGYAVGPKAVKSDKARNWCCCLVLALSLIFFMSATALGLGIFLMINDGQEPTSRRNLQSTDIANNSTLFRSIEDMEEIIAELQRDVAYLREEKTKLNSELAKIRGDVKNEVQPLYKEVTHLRNTQRDTVASISAVDDRLTTRIANISLTPGPQGAVGVANFSLCVSRSVAQNAAASNIHPTNTQYLPSNKDIQNYVLIFAFCTMKGAQDKRLELKRVAGSSISYHQYRCVCTGSVPGEDTTKCAIDAILCPKLQVQGVP